MNITDYKTTIFGMIAAGAGFVAFAPEVFSATPWVQKLAGFIMAGGMAGLGLTAKDTGKGSDRPAAVADAKLSNIPPMESPAEAEKYPPAKQ